MASLAIEEPLGLGLQRSKARLPVGGGQLPIQGTSLDEPAGLTKVVGTVEEDLGVAGLALEGRLVSAVGQVAFSPAHQVGGQAGPDIGLARTQSHRGAEVIE